MKIDNRYLSSSVRASIKQYKARRWVWVAGVARLGWWWLWCGDTGDRVTGHNCHNNTPTLTHRASAGTWGRTQSVLCLKTKE